MPAVPRSLFGYLVLAQIAYGGILAAGFLVVLEFTHTRYHLETTQRQSLGLAGEILSRYRREFAPAGPGSDPAPLREFLRHLGYAGPATDFHMVDGQGNILASSLPAPRLRRASVSIGAVESLVLNPQRLPVTIDDPSEPGVSRIFSAARIGSEAEPAGYLLLVLRGQDTGTFRSHRGSYVFPESIVLIAGVSVLAFGTAVFLLVLILRPIRRLSRTMEMFRRESGIAWPDEDGTGPDPKESELERLSRHFNEMARQIVELLHRLKDDDRKMREMFANISHDLRTPLTVIQGSLETLQIKDGSLPTGDRSRLMGVAVAQTLSLGRLIEAVFELSKLQSPDYQLHCEPFSVAEVVQDVAMKFSVKARERGMSIGIVGGERHIHIMADVLLIERVFDNLIDNALRHAEGADGITIRLAERAEDVEIMVCDNGSGIPAAVRSRILKESSGKPPSYPGTTEQGAGLGLSIVRRILELHGSSFELVTTESGGAAFRFALSKAVRKL
jgi:two-component system OmpR family sensor kinase